MTQEVMGQIEEEARKVFRDKWDRHPLGPEVIKEELFKLFNLGFLSAFIFMAESSMEKGVTHVHDRSLN